MDFYPIIPAGGAGSRLWPLSRKARPKFLTDLTGSGKSLLQLTLDRLAPLSSRPVIVTGASHADDVREQAGEADVVVEPKMRGTMAAIGLAAAIIEHRHGDAIVGSFAADHVITDEGAFREAVRGAIEAAEAGYVVTIGISPDGPSTAYGYIHGGADLPTTTRAAALSVSEFVEKPQAEVAARYLATGEYFWNAGMFIAKASVLLDALQRFHPEIAEPLRQLGRSWDGPDRERTIEQCWEPLPVEVIDRAVAEPLAAEGGVAMVPCEMGWSDVGDYASLGDVVPEAGGAHAAPGGVSQPTVILDSPDSLVYTSTKPVVVVGVPDAVVVEMDDVILVTQKSASQQVKGAVDTLEESGLGYLQ
ncbi:MAG: mannose-1-phosphate guanylyltransferase [Ancrocorticia populi]|uniref:mannose-1-phosphate guanylyltransferase n=1 Tax=Ancrocorticia populi TaxID=2175228 RepID=UPI003F92E3A2